jgi:hypothetical protein
MATRAVTRVRPYEKGNKKAEVVTSAVQHAGGCFLLSPKGPPSCWRAKPVIKAIQLALSLLAGHCKSSLFVLDIVEFVNSLI